ncbi:unnamed protein product [Spodoptera littoralis]|uniref:Uncharacterized protein n=1 Tax=Spodoptera littoralis TaxID=7109 RepID=A0A9P0N4I0_SPOLI|nr:unnamed protein product [Spodoptera littoralis]CAH1644507.1 unnamed protein product [Spodoptera littoralis]
MTPSTWNLILSDVNKTDCSNVVMKKVRRAADIGHIPSVVMNDILARVLPDDGKSDVVKKVSKAVQKRKLSKGVIHDITNCYLRLRGEEPIVEKVKTAIEMGEMSPSLETTLKGLAKNDTEKICSRRSIFNKNYRKGRSKIHVPPSVKEEMYADLLASENKSQIIKNVRKGASNT